MAATIVQLYKELKNGIEYGGIKVSIPTADVLTLNGTPITILAAPGSTKMIIPTRVVNSIQTYGGAAYATNTSFRHYIDTAVELFCKDDSILLSSAIRTISPTLLIPTGATDTQFILNKAMKIFVAAGNPTAGNSTVISYVDYQIITP